MTALTDLDPAPVVGIVGFGDIAQYHWRHLAEAGAIVAGAVTRRPLPGELARYPDVDTMLAEVDAITIAVPNHLHADLCVRALTRRRAVFVEKPLCMTWEDCDRIAAFDDVPLLVGYRLRWNPALSSLRAMSPANPAVVRCSYSIGIERMAGPRDWMRRSSTSGGPFFLVASHALDLARWFARAAGQPLLDVAAGASHVDGSADFPLVTWIDGSLPNGPRVEVRTDLRGDGAFALELELESTKGAISLRSLRGELPAPHPEDDCAAEAEYGAMMHAFVDMVRHDDVDSRYLVDSVQTHRDLVSAHEAALT